MMKQRIGRTKENNYMDGTMERKQRETQSRLNQAFVCKFYNSCVYRDDFVIDSTRGFQQGDGLSIYFPLVIYDIFRDDHEIAANLLNLWYHDDGVSHCDLSLVENNINHINERLKIAGMNLSVPKTEIYTNSDEIEILADLEQRYGVKIKRSLNFECLGSFIGDLESSHAFLDRQYEEYCEIIDLLGGD